MTSLAEAPLSLASDREPGIYADISIEEYHRDRTSLSASGAKELLASCPAKFHHLRDHPSAPSAAMEFGTALHALVLGDGPEVQVCDYASWKSGKAQQEKLAALADGKIPVLAKEKAQLDGMAAAVRNHHTAAPRFAPGSGVAEQSLYLRHRDTGVMRRARPDWLPHFTGERLLVPDLKSCVKADLDSIQKDIANYRYFMQGPWYLDLIKGLGLCGDEEPKFLFVFVEKSPPYLVTVVEQDQTSLDAGRRENATALHTYADCTASGNWPDYMAPFAPYIPQVALPAWLERQFV